MILIDGNLLAHRAFHKMDFLKNKDGVHTGLEYGFLRSVEMLEKKFEDHKIIICFDTAKNRKRTEGGRYKANRKAYDGGFYDRVRELQKFLLNYWDLAWQSGEEADDVMYTLAKRYLGPEVFGEEIYIYSNDNDLLQCVSDKVFVLKSHESSLYIWDADKVEDKYGLPPSLLVLYRSFIGDPSDNLSGVPRIQKRVLVDAIHYALGKTPEFDPVIFASQVHRYTGWSDSVMLKIEDFVKSGLWRENYDLMLLQECDYEYFSAKFDKDHVIKKLREWEIGSLNMCKPFSADLVDPESEF